jgi:hypothetical protein
MGRRKTEDYDRERELFQPKMCDLGINEQEGGCGLDNLGSFSALTIGGIHNGGLLHGVGNDVRRRED